MLSRYKKCKWAYISQKHLISAALLALDILPAELRTDR